jgi:hypothetical protein
VKRRFRFTHPFHPLFGREFDAVDFRQSWGDDWLYFYDDGQQLVSVRTSWTDVGAADPFVVLAAGRSAFRPADLLELARQVGELRRREV